MDTTLMVILESVSVAAAIVDAQGGTLGMRRVVRVPIAGANPAALESALKELVSTFAKEPCTSVAVFLTSPWFVGSMRTVVSNAERPVTISRSTITRAVSTYRDEKPPRPQYQDVEAVAFHVSVNGYETRLVHSVRGSALRINVYESEVEVALAERIRAILHDGFPRAAYSLHTMPLAVSTALRAVSDLENFAVAVVSGESTDMVVIDRNSIQYQTSFPVGFMTIAGAFPNAPSAADSLSRLALFTRGELSEDAARDLDSGAPVAFKSWREAWNAAMGDVSNTVPLPPVLYLVSPSAHASWLTLFSSGATPGLMVQSVIPSLLQRYIVAESVASFDASLAIAGIFFHTALTDIITPRA